MREIIRLNRSLYRGCLFLYPRDLRRRFGTEMVDVFEEQARESFLRRGLAGLASVWGLALWELLVVAAPSRLSSNTLIAGALSFLASSVLFLAFFSAVQ